jgi:hypothetical protein
MHMFIPLEKINCDILINVANSSIGIVFDKIDYEGILCKQIQIK